MDGQPIDEKHSILNSVFFLSCYEHVFSCMEGPANSDKFSGGDEKELNRAIFHFASSIFTPLSIFHEVLTPNVYSSSVLIPMGRKEMCTVQ